MGTGDADCKLQVIYLMIFIHLGHLPSEVTNQDMLWPMEGTQEENDRGPGLESWKKAIKYKVRRGFLKTCVQGGDGSGAENSKHLGSQPTCYGHNSKNTVLLFGSRTSTLPNAFLVKHCVCVCVCVCISQFSSVAQSCPTLLYIYIYINDIFDPEPPKSEEKGVGVGEGNRCIIFPA